MTRLSSSTAFRGRLGHDLQSISLPTTVPFAQQLEILERFATEVIPVLRRELPTTLWTDADPAGARPEVATADVHGGASTLAGAAL